MQQTISQNRIRTLPKNNYSAIIDPTINDDTGNGYLIGSLLINIISGNAFVCVDNSNNVAILKKTTIEYNIPVKDNFTSTSIPISVNDISQGYSIGSMWINVDNNKSYICVDNSLGAAILIECAAASSTETGISESEAIYISMAYGG